VFSPRRVPLHPEDAQILEIVKQLCDQLHYHKQNIQTISWRDRIGIRQFPIDGFLIGYHQIMLSARLIGQLSPEEWRPIIASGLYYYKHLGRGMLRSMLTTIIPAIILFVPGLFIAFRYLGGAPTAFIILLTLLEALIVIQGIRLFIFQKRLWFKADQEAAELAGREALLSSLRRIGSIGQISTTMKKGFLRPSLQERIDHLSR
jgi:Zn-dependent protease with chaperone function